MTSLPQRVMYVAQLAPGSTSSHRAQALRELGIEVCALDTHPASVRRRESTLVRRALRYLIGPRDLARVNPAMLEAARRGPFDLVWIDKGTTVERSTLIRLRKICPGVRIVHYCPDDPFGEYGTKEFRRFLRALPEYDLHLVPRTPNVAEYLAVGARRVEHVVPFWGYDPRTHRPVSLSEAEQSRFGAPVGFIGMAERERAASIARLAREGLTVKVWGNRWPTFLKPEGALDLIAGPAQFGEAYARIIAAFGINLAFLRKQHRDQHTSRSVELPAAGAFMLAQRSEEHRQLFVEGHEAEFFGDDDELVAKVRYYVDRPELRARIAAAGRERCLREGYDNRAVMLRMLSLAMQE